MLKSKNSQNLRPHPAFTSDSALKTGKLLYVNSEGKPLVTFNGNTGDPIIARSTISLEDQESEMFPVNILLFFDDNDPHPIIVGIIRDTISAPPNNVSSSDIDNHQKQVNINVKTLNLEAGEEIILKCGDSSIELTKRGKVIIKGIEIVTRSARTNRIKGASVQIN